MYRGRDRLWIALKCVGAAAFFFAMLATPAHADPRSELAQARHDLAISEQVLARVSARADAARSDPGTTTNERERLDQYFARVRDLVELNRERVRSLEQAIEVLPAGLPAGGRGGRSAPAAATHAEEVAALDAKLSDSLAEFDQLLLEEARKARARAPTRASAGGYGTGANGGATGAGQPSSNESSTTSATTSRNGDADPAQSGGTGPGSPGGRIEGTDPGAAGPTAAVPPDVGDGSDDDIVARQIRRAAETETDPELREKLWDEYRKYKEGTKG